MKDNENTGKKSIIESIIGCQKTTAAYLLSAARHFLMAGSFYRMGENARANEALQKGRHCISLANEAQGECESLEQYT